MSRVPIPSWHAQGSVNFDPDVLQLHLDVESPLLSVPLLINGAVNSDGRVALTLLERGAAAPIASLVGVPDADRRAMTLDGRIELSGRPLAFAAAYAKATIESGSVLIEGHGRAAWPLPTQAPWKALTLDGRYLVEFVASTPAISRAQARVGGDFTFADDALKVRVDSGSTLLVDVPELRASRDRERDSPSACRWRLTRRSKSTTRRRNCGSATVSSSPPERLRIRSSSDCAAHSARTVILNSAS